MPYSAYPFSSSQYLNLNYSYLTNYPYIEANGVVNSENWFDQICINVDLHLLFTEFYVHIDILILNRRYICI